MVRKSSCFVLLLITLTLLHQANAQPIDLTAEHLPGGVYTFLLVQDS